MVYLGIIGQTIAAVLLIVGVTLQLHNGAALSNIIVSGGGLVFAIFTKIRLLGYEWDEMINKGRKKRGS